MANNDYWAYLRNENELKHGRPKGSRNGFTTMENYTPVGNIAKGVFDATTGRYVYDKAKKYITGMGSALKKAAGSIKENIRQKQIINRNNKLEAKRTNYGDMAKNAGRAPAALNFYPGQSDEVRYDPLTSSESTRIRRNSKYEKGKLEAQAEAASQKRKAAIEEEYRNNHRDVDARPQDAMKEGQAKARQEAEERKLYEDWLAEQEEAKRKKGLARNQANLDKWGYKDEDDAGSTASKYASAKAGGSLNSKAETLKKLKEELKESLSKKTIDRSSRPESKPEKKTVAVDANTGRVIPGYNPSITGNTGYGNLGEKWRKNKSRS